MSNVIIFFTFDPIIIFVFFLLSFFAVTSINAGVGDCEVFHDERKIWCYVNSTVRNIVIHSQLDFLLWFFSIPILIVPNFRLGLVMFVASAKFRFLNSLQKYVASKNMFREITLKLIKLIKKDFYSRRLQQN